LRRCGTRSVGQRRESCCSNSIAEGEGMAARSHTESAVIAGCQLLTQHLRGPSRKHISCLPARIVMIGWLALTACGRPPELRTVEVRARPLILKPQDWTVRFPEAFPMQIAVLWTDPSSPSLGLIHSLSEMGLPFFVTRSVSQAVTHPILILYPMVNRKSFTVEDVKRLSDYVRSGGVIFCTRRLLGRTERCLRVQRLSRRPQSPLGRL
jgi:hypothetical protein